MAKRFIIPPCRLPAANCGRRVQAI
jgi:hypothetical protein